jgi:hypothetical protein
MLQSFGKHFQATSAGHLLRLGFLVGAHRVHSGLDQQTVNSKWTEGINCGQLQMLPFYLRLQKVLQRINTGINIPTPDVGMY